MDCKHGTGASLTTWFHLAGGGEPGLQITRKARVMSQNVMIVFANQSAWRARDGVIFLQVMISR